MAVGFVEGGNETRMSEIDVVAKILYDFSGFTDSWDEAREELKDLHREKVRALQEAGADFSAVHDNHLDREFHRLLDGWSS